MYDVAHGVLLHPDWAAVCPLQAGVHADSGPTGRRAIRDCPIGTYTGEHSDNVNMKTISLPLGRTMLTAHKVSQISKFQLPDTVSFLWSCFFSVKRARASCSSGILPSRPWLVPLPPVRLLVHRKALVVLLDRLSPRRLLSQLRKQSSGRLPILQQPLLLSPLPRQLPRRVAQSVMSRARRSTAMFPSGSRTPTLPRLRRIVSILTLHHAPRIPSANKAKPTLPTLPSRAFSSIISTPSPTRRSPTTSRPWQATTLA